MIKYLHDMLIFLQAKGLSYAALSYKGIKFYFITSIISEEA